MATITGQKAKDARIMLQEGKTIYETAEALGFSYEDVQSFAWDTGALSWQGAKKSVTNRLKKFKSATKAEDRQILADEIKFCVDYLYESGRKLQGIVEKTRKAVNGE